VGVDGDHPPADAAGAGVAQRAAAAGDAESCPSTATPGRADRHGHPRRAGHGAGLEVDAELVFGEPPAGCGRELGLDHRREPLLVEPGQVSAGAVGAVAVDHRPSRLSAALAVGGEVAEQPRRDHGVAAGGQADLGGADHLCVGVDRHVGLVAVKAVGGGLVAVAGLWVDGGDDPVGCGARKDPETPVSCLLDVLAGDGGQQRGRLGGSFIQPLPTKGVVGPVGVADQRVHQRLPGLAILPVTGRLARRSIVIVALQPRSYLRLERGRTSPQQPPDRPPQHGHGVLGGDRVLQRGRVQHPTHPHQPHLAGQRTGHPEDPIRIGRATQPRPQIHQHRVGKAGRLFPSHRIGHPSRIPPAHVEGEPVGRLPIRQPLQPLQHHHHRQDRRRHRPPPRELEQVAEQLGREQPSALPGQEPVHRPLGQRRLTPASTGGGQLRAAQLTAKGHSSLQVRRQGPESASSAGHRRIRHRTPAT
jgi:hypothetical protein